jgi:hypothetical protein
MILKANLAAIVVFALAFVGVLLFGTDPSQVWSSNHLWIGLLFFLSPALLWAAGARVVRGCQQRDADGRQGESWSSSVWFVASVLFLSLELYALILEAMKYRQEAITGHYTQSIGGFLTVLLQWAAGLLLLAILALIEWITRE